jgi:enamine deaminase RidA (YjgF/YER057c/UK114 family)
MAEPIERKRVGETEVFEPVSWPYYVYKGGDWKLSMSFAIQKKDYLFLAGNAASQFIAELNRIACKGDILEQARVVYDKMRRVLEGARANFADVIRTVDYVTVDGLASYKATADIRRDYFGDNLPASTTVVVRQLMRSKCLQEIDGIGVVGNTKREAIDPGWERYERFGCPPAAKKGNLLALSTQCAVDHNTGKLVGKGDIVAQIRKVYENIQEILEAAGASFDDVVKTIDYVAPEGLADYKATDEIRRDYFGENGFSAHIAVVTPRLLLDDTLIEVECTAVLGGGKKQAINPGWERYETLTYRPAVKKGNLVCLSGVSSIDPKTGKLIDDDVVGQMEQAFRNATAILKSVGLSHEKDVLRTIDYLVPEGRPSYRDTNQTRLDYFTKIMPTATGVLINELMPKGVMVEIDLVAVAD